MLRLRSNGKRPPISVATAEAQTQSVEFLAITLNALAN